MRMTVSGSVNKRSFALVNHSIANNLDRIALALTSVFLLRKNEKFDVIERGQIMLRALYSLFVTAD